MAGVWVTDGWNMSMTPPDAEFLIVEMESAGDYDGIMNHPTPTIPHAIVTNFGPFTDSGRDPAPLIAEGWVCQTECYMGDNPNATPDRLNWTAQQWGWAHTQPVFGLYNAPASTYAQWADWPGADYLMENVL